MGRNVLRYHFLAYETWVPSLEYSRWSIFAEAAGLAWYYIISRAIKRLWR